MDTDTDRILVIPNDVFFSRVCESLGEGGKVTFTVKGHSMFPFLRSGKDRVCLVKPESGGLAAGDVILFRFRGNYILHRIYGIRKTPDGTPLYVTMGDGNTRGTETAEPASIVGVMVKRITPEGREWECGSQSWELCSLVWMKLLFVRRWCLAVLRRICR